MSPERDSADVIGLGENSVDRVLLVPTFPGARGATPKVRVKKAIRSCGGQVATTIAACAAMGVRTRYAGAVGDDDDGELVRSTLNARGIDLSHMHTRPSCSTRWATILVDAGNGDRSVMWDRDDRLSLTSDEVDAIDVGAARVIHVDDTDIAASIRLAESARRAGRYVTTDIDAGSSRERAMTLLSIATHPILSEHALIVLSGETDTERGLRALRKQCAGLLCVTLGPRGAMALDGEALIAVNGFIVSAIDTTGAGDVFRAGVIVSLLAGQSTAAMLTFANAAAALSCTRVGAIASVPSREDVDALLAKAVTR